MKKILFAYTFSLLLASCIQKQNEADFQPAVDIQEEAASPARKSAGIHSSPNDNQTMQERIQKKIVKNGRIGLRVSDLSKSKVRIDSLVKQHEGYLANENFTNSDWESAYNLVIRIPAANFESFIGDIETGEQEMLYKSIDSHDVTDQFIDIETRLDSKSSYLKRYKELLGKAKNVQEILEIEEKIRGLEEEIESTKGRLNYLNSQVVYSTLDLSLTMQKALVYNPMSRVKFTERVKQSIVKGWFGFVAFILFTIKIWPFWIIVSIALYFWKRFRKPLN